MKSPDVENLLETLGQPGKLQSISFFFLCINLCIVMTNHMASVFFAAKTEYSCKMDRNTSSHVLPLTSSHGDGRTDSCYILVNNSREKCTAWNYNLPDGETTIISEFDLVCDDAYKSDLSTTIYFAGVMLGGVVFGFLADKYGRKRVVILALLCSGIVSVATFVFRTSFTAYIILRFFLGFLMQGIQNSSFILALETLSMKYRTTGGLIFVISGGIGVLFLDVLVYVVKDWKYVQLATGVLPFLQALAIWFIPESLRWNIVQKNFNEAEIIIKRTIKLNKLTFPQKLFDEIKNDAFEEKCEQVKRKGNVLDVFKSPKLRKITFVLFLAWFTFSTTYYGLAFHISHLFGSKYLNFAISTILDAIGTSSLFWIMPRYGRRRPLAISFFTCALVTSACSIMASQSVSGPAVYIGTAMAIIGKTTIACCGTIGYIFTSELYPTIVRNVSFGMNTFWTRVGGMAAPQIFFLETYTSSFVPYTILAVLASLNCLLTLSLPETNNTGFADRFEISMSSLLDKQDDFAHSSCSDKKKIECYETSI